LRNSPEQRHGLVRKFTTLLNPGGAVLLDAYTLNAFALREETVRCEKNLLHGFWSRQDYYGFLNVFKYEREKVVLDKYTIVEPSRTRVIYNWLQYFSPETLIRELESGGLVVEHSSPTCGTPFSETTQEMAVIARKPEKSGRDFNQSETEDDTTSGPRQREPLATPTTRPGGRDKPQGICGTLSSLNFGHLMSLCSDHSTRISIWTRFPPCSLQYRLPIPTPRESLF
jgi:hypothetical protein